MHSPDEALIILTRYPAPGAVKTRLAQTLGDTIAVEFYRRCAERLFLQSRQLPRAVRRYLFYAGVDGEEALLQWAGGQFTYEAQRGQDLGERMRNAFHHVFARRAPKAIVVGTDIPDLTAELMERALHRLQNYDVVIGPDHNGGYYLLGMKLLHETLFQGISWGTSRVYGQTLRLAKGLGLSVAFLPVLVDVDTEDDLRRWMAAQHPSDHGTLEAYVSRILPR